jgi:nitrate reductase NapD
MISGIVVAARPEGLSKVRSEIDALEFADVHYADPSGRLVVTIEAPGIEASMKCVEEIGRLNTVLSVSLAQYHMEENELEGEPKPCGNAGSPELVAIQTPRDRRER